MGASPEQASGMSKPQSLFSNTSPTSESSSSVMRPQPSMDAFKVNPNIKSPIEGISNIVKAIMGGNSQFMARQGGMGAPQAKPPGEPLSLAPDNVTATPAQTSPALVSPQAPSPTGGGTAGPMPMAPAQPAAPWQANSGGMLPFMRQTQSLPWMPANGTLASNGSGSTVPGLPNGADPTIQALLGTGGMSRG